MQRLLCSSLLKSRTLLMQALFLDIAVRDLEVALGAFSLGASRFQPRAISSPR